MIQIDMEMPKDCRNCPLAIYLETEELKCTATGQNVYYVPAGERDLICPLQEVKEVKEVKAEDVCPKVPEGVPNHLVPYLVLDYFKSKNTALCDTCLNADKCSIFESVPFADLWAIKKCDKYLQEKKK